MWKIWTSELYSGNKVTAHNTFAVPLIIPTIGILNWTWKEIEDLDKVTRQIMCYTRNLHMRSDINRIYVPQKLGGRGLVSIEDSFTARMIWQSTLKKQVDTNAFMKRVKQHEQENIIRLKDHSKINYKSTITSNLKNIQSKLLRQNLNKTTWKHGKTNLSIAISSRKLKQMMKWTRKHRSNGSTVECHHTWKDT